jgi:hypothetical protein
MVRRVHVDVRKRFGELSPRTRKLIIAAGVAEAGLKAVALRDIRNRPASQVRGPRWLWAGALVLVGSFGALPLSYLAFGRRK